MNSLDYYYTLGEIFNDHSDALSMIFFKLGEERAPILKPINKQIESDFHKLCIKGNLCEIKKFNSNEFYAKNSFGECGLDLAIKYRHLKLIKHFLEVDENLFFDAKSKFINSDYKSNRFNPFYYCMRFYPEALEVILSHADYLMFFRFNLFDNNNLMHLACMYGNDVLINHFFKYSTNYDETNSKGNTYLHCLVKNKDIKNICKLLEYEPNVNLKNKNGDTPLHLAVIQGNLEIVKCLAPLSKLSLQNEDGDTPLHIAVIQGNLEIVKCLAPSSKLSSKNNLKNTPLHLAVIQENLGIVKCLAPLSKLSLKNIYGFTPLYIARIIGNKQMIKFLFDLS